MNDFILLKDNYNINVENMIDESGNIYYFSLPPLKLDNLNQSEDETLENYLESSSKITNKKLGRKRTGDNSERKHTKDSQDNQMKRIKTFAINKSLIPFLNEILKNYEKFKGKQFQIMNYQEVIEKLTKKINMEFFKMTLDIFLSYENKNLKPGKLTNKEIIDEIKDNTNEEDDIRKCLKITLEEWFAIFTKKNKLENLELSKTPKLLNKDDFLKTVRNEKLEEYHSGFEILLNDPIKWFENKNGRSSKKSKFLG